MLRHFVYAQSFHSVRKTRKWNLWECLAAARQSVMTFQNSHTVEGSTTHERHRVKRPELLMTSMSLHSSHYSIRKNFLHFMRFKTSLRRFLKTFWIDQFHDFSFWNIFFESFQQLTITGHCHFSRVVWIFMFLLRSLNFADIFCKNFHSMFNACWALRSQVSGWTRFFLASLHKKAGKRLSVKWSRIDAAITGEAVSHVLRRENLFCQHYRLTEQILTLTLLCVQFHVLTAM